MKRILFSLFLLFFVIFNLFSQDTVLVQTLTYDSTGRDYVFDFPQDTNQNYEKILMLYSMRCKGAKVSTGSDRNKGCGEWDYSCNTYIIDSSFVDSVKTPHPSHLITGFDGDVFTYTTEKTYSFYRYKQYSVSNDTIVFDSIHNVVNGTYSLKYPFNLSSATSKSQYLFTSSELNSAGINTGEISAIDLKILEGSSEASFLRIKIKEVEYDKLEQGVAIETDEFEEVYFKNTILEEGINRFDFYKKFDWNGTSNILIEFSYTNNDEGEDIIVEGDKIENKALLSIGDDYFLNFSGIGKVYLNNTDFSSISDAITISFWAYGNEDKLPANTTAFEGLDENNKRQANVHFPWGNSRIYWDCGNEDNSYDRIDKQANDDEIRGKWNYWAFTKNTKNGLQKIYKNGEIWHSGSGKKKSIDIKKLVFGGSYNNNYPYYGFIDNFAIWNKKLDTKHIKKNMYERITPSNLDFENLVAYYKLNENSGLELLDFSNQGAVATHSGTSSHKLFRGKDRFKEMVISGYRPNISFHQGEYVQTISEEYVLDSIQNDQNKIYYYGLNGTDLILLDSLIAYKAGESFVIDVESGEIVDTVFYIADDTINITTLNYFRKIPSRFEIMSFVTPYGIGLDLGPNGKTWEFDVTDFKPILNGKKRMKVEFGKYQEELDIKFLFIKGTPPRNINKIQQIWRSGSQRNYKDLLSDKFFEPRTIRLDIDSKMFKVRASITGHGQEGEFIDRTHFIKVNGNKEFKWNLKKECADNPIYPQGGTWIYDRSGWCPGAPTTLKEFEIVNVNDSFSLDYGLEYASGDSRYLINCQLVSYGEPNFNTDAAIVDIKRPTQKIEYGRFNPVCLDPIIVIQNTGKNILTSLNIEYSVEGGDKKIFSWNGELDFLEKEEVVLPIENTSFWNGNGSNIFVTKISNPNNTTDEYSDNNVKKSSFDLPDILVPEFTMVLKTNKRANENKVTLKNLNGESIINKISLSNTKKYEDELELAEGCYELEVTDSGNDGLRFWANASQGSGYLYFKNKNAIKIKTFNPDFGKILRYSFMVSKTDKTEAVLLSSAIEVFPNPISDEMIIRLNLEINRNSTILISDINGRVVQKMNNVDLIKNGDIRITMNNKPRGVYLITYMDDKVNITKKIVLE